MTEDKHAPIKQRHTSVRIFERLTDEYGDGEHQEKTLKITCKGDNPS
ncbi:hypothetical protein [Paenibacillus glacialis]|nr:hypothetical protein [Paenibacillus glacialis]